MSARNRFVKVRLSPDEYRDVLRRADTDGLTMCEHIRQQLLGAHDQLDLQAELAALRAQLGAIQTSRASSGDPLVLEAVLLLRELAAARDAQMLTRVRAQLSQATGEPPR